MAKNLKQLMSERTPESQQRIADMAEEMLLEVRLQAMREELALSQAEVAKVMGISQPSVVAIEQRGNDIKLSTMKRYVEAMGGKLRLNIELPDGRHMEFAL
ncbi:transcriptional regulator [Rahnella victoriana]|uniref:helix-turn-helix domain-containing protein n=1 Tax=Rahnella victoriana TaxID=1510570 RepID=UPI000BB1F134|nr:helix-turn-helix transcriptional regulator [Rahnella victoriana]PBI79540.1 transcriptional regulator [Rahnella victoriana]